MKTRSKSSTLPRCCSSKFGSESEWVEIDGLFLEHDVARSRFIANVGHGERPYLTYLVDLGSKTMEIQHTFVPKAKRGRGIAKALCDRAFMFARRNKWEVIPTCTYVSGKYLKRGKWFCTEEKRFRKMIFYRLAIFRRRYMNIRELLFFLKKL